MTTTDIEIARYARIAAKRAVREIRAEGRTVDACSATDIYDIVRDHAYDVLLACGGDDLLDDLLYDVTDEATERLLDGAPVA